MDTNEARRLALSLMAEHGVTGAFHFKFDRAVRRFGCTKWHSVKGNFITMSEPMTRAATPEQVRETMLHEIAHALAGPRAGHGPAWRMQARALGIVPARCGEATAEQKAVVMERLRTFEIACVPCAKVLGTVQGLRKPSRFNNRSHSVCRTRVTVREIF